ncbi:MAG: 30S ribosomal protein S1 [Anaerolineae bacterium]
MNQSDADNAAQEQEFATMWENMGDTYDYVSPARGDVRKGVVISARSNEILIDIGAKQDAIVSSRDLENMSREEIEAITPGKEVNVYIVRADDREEQLVVSIRLARAYEDWDRAQEVMDSGGIVEAQVISHNKGGLVVSFGNLQGFVPMSQIANLSQRTGGDTTPEGLASLVGEELALKVIEVNRRRRRLILSERSARREWRAAQRDRLMEEIKEGDIRTGTVSSLRDFGAFVDLGGADGLVHISELSWSRVRHPGDLLKVGQTVEVMVLRVDPEAQRIGLSLKRVQPDPWAHIEDKYKIDAIVRGTVTHLVKFGAFVELEPGVEGLIHVSELADAMVEDPSEIVAEGDDLTLRVLGVDAERHQIALSLRGVAQEAQEPEATEASEHAEPSNGDAPETVDGSEAVNDSEVGDREPAMDRDV